MTHADPLAGTMTLTLRPRAAGGPPPGIYVRVLEDEWNPSVLIVRAVTPEQGERALAALPLPGRIAPVQGGEERTRGRLFTTLSPAPADFDPWTAAQAPTFETLAGLDDDRLKQVAAAIGVTHYRAVIERTGKFVLQAIYCCRHHRLTPPDWLWDMFTAQLQPVLDLQVGSLDQAFHQPRTTEKKRVPIAKRHALRQSVMAHLIAEVVRSPTMAINKALYAVVAERCGTTAKQCEEIYYEARDKFGFQDLTYLKEKLLEELDLSGRSGRNGRIRTKRPRR